MTPTAFASWPMYVCVVPASLPSDEQLEQRLLEAADEHHPLVEAREIGHADRGSRWRFLCHDSPDRTATHR